jgi:hypothetical protein
MGRCFKHQVTLGTILKEKKKKEKKFQNISTVQEKFLTLLRLFVRRCIFQNADRVLKEGKSVYFEYAKFFFFCFFFFQKKLVIRHSQQK